jgi:hypothetical protein
MAKLDQTQAKLKKVLESTHPMYNRNAALWKLYEDCYNGGQSVINRIHKHLRESLTSVRQRRARAFYPNYCQTVVDAYMSYIFRKGVVRQAIRKEDQLTPEQRAEHAWLAQHHANMTAQQQAQQGQEQNVEGGKPAPKNGAKAAPPAPIPGVQGVPQPDLEMTRLLTEAYKRGQKKTGVEKELDEFWKDVDLMGNPIDQYMTEVGIWMMIFGVYHSIVDMPEAKGDIQSEADRKEQGLRPYLSQVSPLCLINWEYDRSGQLLWIRIKEEVSSGTGPFEEKGKKSVIEYRTWTQKDWHVHRVEQDKVERVGRGTHDLNEVPLVTFYQSQKTHLAPISNSFIKDIGPINLAVLNWGSLIDNEAYERCLNILVMERSQQTPGEIVIGTDNVLEYEKGGVPPHFLAASTAPAAFIQAMIREAVQEIYRLSRLGGLTGRMVREARSGVAYKFESHEANQALSAKADRLEAGEKRVHELHEKWLGREWKGVIDYPEEFGIESIEEEVALMTQVKQQLRSPTLKRLMEKKSAAKLLGKVPKSTLQVVDEEIDTLEEVKPTFSMFGG